MPDKKQSPSVAELRQEIADLKHDLDRYMKIANEECNRAEALLAEREKLREIADFLVDQKGEPWPSGAESDRLHYWRDKAIEAANRIRAAIASSPKEK